MNLGQTCSIMFQQRSQTALAASPSGRKRWQHEASSAIAINTTDKLHSSYIQLFCMRTLRSRLVSYNSLLSLILLAILAQTLPLATAIFSDHQTPNMAATALGVLRPIAKVVRGEKMSEGAGVQITRTVGTYALRNLDPYLMLDELKLPANQATAGFPDHPHRGFETCSIMLEGQIEHKDSVGNQGVIGPGGVQWMTAGRGIIHSEMPKTTDGMLWGFQLWINLPKKDKMCKPRYQDYQAKDIPIVEKDNLKVRVMAGTSYGTTGPIKMRNPGMLLDVRLAKGGSFEQEVPADWSGFAYVYNGTGKLCGTKAQPEHAMVLGDGDHIIASTDSDEGLRFLLIAGRPIKEPILQHGPFVMNTQAEIQQAFLDYQMGRLQNPEDNPWRDDEL